jgi:hypothetical protein
LKEYDLDKDEGVRGVERNYLKKKLKEEKEFFSVRSDTI